MANHHAAPHWKTLQELDVASRAAPPWKPKELQPKTQNHRDYLAALQSKPVTLCVGPAGTAKTWTAVGVGVQQLLADQFEKLIIVRPMVECGRRLGATPGDLGDKISPYVEAALEVLQDFVSPEDLKSLRLADRIRLDTFETLRGKTFHRSFVILDEAQNADEGQVLMLPTRLGQGSRVAVNGDDSGTQSDLFRGAKSGLDRAWKTLVHPEFARIRMTIDDIVRSGLVRTILELWEGGGHLGRPVSA